METFAGSGIQMTNQNEHPQGWHSSIKPPSRRKNEICGCPESSSSRIFPTSLERCHGHMAPPPAPAASFNSGPPSASFPAPTEPGGHYPCAWTWLSRRDLYGAVFTRNFTSAMPVGSRMLFARAAMSPESHGNRECLLPANDLIASTAPGAQCLCQSNAHRRLPSAKAKTGLARPFRRCTLMSADPVCTA